MQSETPADKGGKIYVNCNMCHGMKGEKAAGRSETGREHFHSENANPV